MIVFNLWVFGTFLLIYTGLFGWFYGTPRRFFRTATTFENKNDQQFFRFAFMFGWISILIGTSFLVIELTDIFLFQIVMFVYYILFAYIISRAFMLIAILVYKLWEWIMTH